MWMLLKRDYYTTKKYVVFGERSRFFSGGRHPAVFLVPGRRKSSSYGDFSVYSGDNNMLFVKGDERVEAAFFVSGVRGIKRTVLSSDVFKMLGKLYGVSGRRIRNIIRVSNDLEFVPYFDLSQNYVYAIVDARRPQSVQAFRDVDDRLVVKFYSGSNVYTYSVPKNRKKLFGALFRGKIARGYEEKKRCAAFDEYFTELGRWYLMKNAMYVMNNNVLAELKPASSRIIYPVEMRTGAEVVSFILENGEIWLDHL